MRNQSSRVRYRRWFACLAALVLVLGLAGPAVQPERVAADPGDTPGSAPSQGGLYRDLVPDGQQRHHAIATKVLEDAGYATPCGPAIRMERLDHQRTASSGRGRKFNGKGEEWTTAEKYRADQAEILGDASLSEAERFRQIMEMDIANIRDLFPGKYDAAIAEMRKRYDQLRDVLDARDLEWKSLSSSSSCNPPPPTGGGGGENQPATAVAPSLTVRQAHLHAFMEWDYPEQQMTGEAGTPPGPMQAVFDFTATRHPNRDVVVQIAWGDGKTTDVMVPAGTGDLSSAFTHYYPAPGSPGAIKDYVVQMKVIFFGESGGGTSVGVPQRVTVETC